MKYTVRPATKDDEPFLWEMLYQALFVLPGQPPFPREILDAPEISRYVEDWGKPDDIALLAVEMESGKSVGAAWLRLFTGEHKGYGYVDDATPELTIAVLPHHRGKGVGEKLMNELLLAARAHYTAVSLSVSIGNPAARFYQRLGFVTVKTDVDSVTMTKNLNQTYPNQ